MLTLDELKTAVLLLENELDDADVDVLNEAADKITDYLLQHIAREQLLDTPLTAEICERLGMVRVDSPCDPRTEFEYELGDLSFRQQELLNILYVYNKFTDSGLHSVYPLETETPTIRHLLAAACLAGVTVDLSRLSQGE